MERNSKFSQRSRKGVGMVALLCDTEEREHKIARECKTPRLREAGFEHVFIFEEVKLFRKPK
jgi:hypothetical protein